MSAFVNNAVTGLLGAQRALQTISNNVANANTEGYARQRVEFGENPGQALGGSTIGRGTNITAITRSFDQFVAAELKDSVMGEHRAISYNELTDRLDALLGNPDLSISVSLQRFFDQAEAVNRDPTSLANRQQLIGEAETLANRFAQFGGQLEEVANEVDNRMAQSVAAVNRIAASLADVNQRIAELQTQTPNDLLDKQELLLKDLAQHIDFTESRSSDGGVNVLIGNGQPLVLGVNAQQLTTVRNEFDGSRTELAFESTGTVQLIGGKVAGGELGGIIAFRDEVLAPAQRELGQMALGLSQTFNDQHQRGLDLNGQLGGEFFGDLQPTVAASAKNTGTGSVAATIGDLGAINARDYRLSFDGGTWTLSDASSGAPVSMSGSGTGADPFIAAGMEIVVGGGAAAGDKFLVMPVRQAAGKMSVLASDPASIAAASPVSANTNLQNISAATISNATVDDLTNPNLLDSVAIIFENPATFRIYDAGGGDLTGPLAYTSGDDISLNGWTVQIDGAPQGGDVFSIGATGGGSGNNGNSLLLTNLLQEKVYGNGLTSLAGLGGNLISGIGLAAARADQDLAINTSLKEQAELDMERVSGVNLDEEAAELLKYQEAYLAASRIIALGNELFTNLLNLVAR